ncbi:MAG: AAA family ATPase [Mycoplasmatales bacterium]|nr:AAA family ATPase [Mycoplasmatales bacterium]
MKLIKVETQGFKSFADKTVLKFDGGVVGIVGPNGSGKSNINDAIKWVLGEQSIKSLRGDKVDDIIFSGSKTVTAMKKAFVSLTFDNSDGKVSIPHKIFTITRMVERGVSGNKYFINGDAAKLKDIKEVAMESGIGKSSLAIISQGTIQDIAQATPESRRGIFEEAAGISKYKSRKKEALRKLDKTSDALDKIKTVTRELERQLIPLKKQADKAKIYLEKKAELKDVEIGLIANDAKFFSAQLEKLNSSLEDVINTKEDLNERISYTERELEEKTSHKLQLENDVLKLNQKFENLSERLNALNVSKTRESQRRQMMIDGQIKSSSTERIRAMKDELSTLSKQISQYNIWEERSAKDISEKRELVAEAQTKFTELNYTIDRLKRELLQLKAKLTILKDHRDNKTNLFKGTKSIVDNSNLFIGYEGVVADLIKVDDKYKSAIETVLSNALQHIVMKDSENAVKAVNFLKQNKGGRATFIPLNVIKPKGISENYLMVIKSQPGFIGVAAELINTNPKHEILKKFLLGNIIVADSVESANNISKTINNTLMIVTLDGDIIRAGGVISGGEKGKSRDMLGTDSQIKKIENILPSIEKKIQEKLSEQSKISNYISEEHSLIAELNIETAKVREKSNLIQSQFNQLKTQYESETNEVVEFENQALESSDFLESEKSAIKTQLKSKRESIMSINSVLSSLTITKTELEKSLRGIIDSSSKQMTEKNQAEYILKSQKQRLSEEYEMTIEAAINEYELKIDREEARKIVSNLRQEIKSLGHVNIDSIESYKEVSERFNTLKKSEEELFTAQQTIISAIDQMDQIIISRLDETVKMVNKEMNSIFRTMFGGGFAEVKYTDPSNLLSTGIDVVAQPPGKTVKNLRLFSGGEKAIVAITLLFAILKSKPLPLCILDEVEAALDDANVARYATYLQELKDQTQFIVVTHRAGTMSRVDHLFGATMQTRGVTSFFTVKLADAKKLIE